MKHTVDCLAFRPLAKNTPRGFAKSASVSSVSSSMT